MVIAKWGNSLAVRLPKELVDELGLMAGDEVEISKSGTCTVEMTKIDRKSDFLERMKAFNIPLPEDYAFDRDEANSR